MAPNAKIYNKICNRKTISENYVPKIYNGKTWARNKVKR